VNWRVNHEARNTPQDQDGQPISSLLPARRAGECGNKHGESSC
jgi:hypothetical protein